MVLKLIQASEYKLIFKKNKSIWLFEIASWCIFFFKGKAIWSADIMLIKLLP